MGDIQIVEIIKGTTSIALLASSKTRHMAWTRTSCIVGYFQGLSYAKHVILSTLTTAKTGLTFPPPITTTISMLTLIMYRGRTLTWE